MIKNKKKTKKVVKTKTKPSTKTVKVKTTKKPKKTIAKKSKRVKGFKIPPAPLSESQVKMFLEYYNEHGSFPGSKVPCNITGKLTTCVGPWLVKKIAEYGSPEIFLRKYRCRGALKKAKQIIKGVNPRKKKIKKKDEEGNYIIPPMTISIRRELTDAEKTEMSKSICLRPDVFLDNGRHCDGCMHFQICANPMKCHADPKKKNQTMPRIRMFTNRAQN